MLKNELAQLDQRIAAEAASYNMVAATEIAGEILRARKELKTISNDNQTVNYPYWDSRTRTESENATVIAQQALYEAQQQWKQSIYEDEFDYDYRTKKKKPSPVKAPSLSTTKRLSIGSRSSRQIHD